MIALKELEKENALEYIDMYNEYMSSNEPLIPDILELKCQTVDEYLDLLKEIAKRKNGQHQDLDWYEDGHYYLAYDQDKLIGLGCIRNKLTRKGYDIWGHIACSVRPSKRNQKYGTELVQRLIEESANLGIQEVILCHFNDNLITPKMLKKLGAHYLNDIVSPYSHKLVKRYHIINKL